MSTASPHGRPRSGRHRPASPRRGSWGWASLTGKVLAAALSAVLLLGMGWFWYNYTALDKGLHRVAVSGLGEAPSVSGRPVAPGTGTAQNILLIGSDSRQGLSAGEENLLGVGDDQGTTSTDTLLLIHVPADGSRATLVSIPRDSYVDIPGHPSNKINAAFADGYYYTDGATTDEQRMAAGMNLLVQTVKNLTGVPIDHYVMVNFLGFYNIAKAIDGITVDLCRAVDDTGAHNIAEGNGPVGSGFKMSAGTHDLTPEQSLQFVRQRHNLPGDDLGREARQRYFLGAAFKKIESAGTLLNPSKLTDLVSAIKSTLTVDQDISLQSLADQMINLSAGNIVGQTIPTQGSQDYSGAVGTALDVDPAKVRGQIQAWFAGPKPHTPPTTTPSGGTKTPTAPRPSNGASSVQQVAPNTGCIN